MARPAAKGLLFKSATAGNLSSSHVGCLLEISRTYLRTSDVRFRLACFNRSLPLSFELCDLIFPSVCRTTPPPLTLPFALCFPVSFL